MVSTLMYAVAMGNISLAFLTGLVITPIFSCASPVSNRFQILFYLCYFKTNNNLYCRFGNLCRRMLMIFIHPISFLVISTLIDTYRMFPEELSNPLHFLSKSYVASQRALVYSIVDGTLYGNWLYSLSTCLYLPLWSVAWANLGNRSIFIKSKEEQNSS